MEDRQTENILAFSSPHRLRGLVMIAMRGKKEQCETKQKTNKQQAGETDIDIEEKSWYAINLTFCPPGRFWAR